MERWRPAGPRCSVERDAIEIHLSLRDSDADGRAPSRHSALATPTRHSPLLRASIASMASCPKCGGNIPRSAITEASAAEGIVCPHCKAALQARLRNRMRMNFVVWGFAAVSYAVLVLLGVDRGLAFAIGLLVALCAGFALVRFTRLASRISSQKQGE